MQIAYLCYTESFCSPDLVCDCYEIIDERTRNINFPDSKFDEKIFSTESVTYKGINYVIDLLIITEIGNDDILVFSRIKNIFIRNGEIYLLLKRFQTLQYDDNFNARLLQNRETFILKNQKDLSDFPPCFTAVKNGNLYVITQYDLS